MGVAVVEMGVAVVVGVGLLHHQLKKCQNYKMCGYLNLFGIIASLKEGLSVKWSVTLSSPARTTVILNKHVRCMRTHRWPLE